MEKRPLFENMAGTTIPIIMGVKSYLGHSFASSIG